MAIADEVVKHVEWKRARVSKQRQVTIPLKVLRASWNKR